MVAQDRLEQDRRAFVNTAVATEFITSGFWNADRDTGRGALLAGGSSRIPLVSELIRNEFARPVVTDADPKQAVAMGAARAAGRVRRRVRARVRGSVRGSVLFSRRTASSILR